MTLEDFFTLTEMKDGLTTPARVEDLVSMMQEEKDSVVKNVSDAARQWCTVASTLAATECKDSLDHFIRLNGLYFLDWWLQEAQKCSDGTNDSSHEELISALLGALKKLPIDKEMSVSSGIGVSVKNLFGHKSFRVQETARALFDRWDQGTEEDLDDQDVERDGEHLHSEVKPSNTTVTTTAGSGCLEISTADISPVGGSDGEDNHVVNPDGIQPESTTGVKIPISSDQNLPYRNLSRVDEDRFQGDAQDASVMPTSCQGGVSTMEESSLHTVGRTSLDETCSSPQVEKVNASSTEVQNDGTVSDKARRSPDTLDTKEIDPFPTTIGPEDVPSADPLNPQQSVLEPPILNDADSMKSESCPKRKLLTSFDSDASTLVSKPKSEGADFAVLDNSNGKVECRISNHDGALCFNVSQDSSINDCILKNSEDPEAPFRKEEVGARNDMTELDSESNLRLRDSAIASYISKPNDTKTSDMVDKKRLDMDLDFVVDDALEVARQVAKEVEREVVDYREPLYSSSSEKNAEGKVKQPKSPDSVNGEQDLPTVGPQNEMAIGDNPPGDALSPQGGHYTRDSKSMDRAEDCACDQDSSQVTEAAQEPGQNSEKNFCDFDLNEDFHSEEVDHTKVPISPPIAVAASKAALNQLAPPHHFGGVQGWKGSAATSAFRPASPRRIPDEKALSVEMSSQSSKQRQSFLNIDLNVAGANNDGGSDPVLMKQIPVSSGLPSGESSIEVSSRRAERLKLDLNRVSEDEDAPLSDCRMEGQVLYRTRNGHHSPSPASSSSSRQPSILNIDLNDNLCILDTDDQRLDLGESSSHASGGLKRDDPVISIMGAGVAVNGREISPQAGLFLPNGQVTEFPTGANIARSSSGVGAHSAMSYLPAPGFVYNRLSMGATTSISPIIYGSTSASGPYRVDSRVPVVPHITSSPVGVPAPYSQSPFLVSMSSMPSGFRGVGSRIPNVDLNSGWAESVDNERECGSLRQLLLQAPAALEEEMRSAASQPSSSGTRAKRREPDGGWDSYPVVYKQQAPWQ